ncbi:MAG: hypothetical protein PUC29_02000 [Clostridia bacterium]|nr:hypothetical protein [Clostridia bacterium]
MDFLNIRDDSVYKIFKASLNPYPVSRSEIAENTGISIMTVGKVVDILVNNGVLYQHAARKSNLGRRARVVEGKSDLRIAVYSLTDTLFSLSLTDISLRVKATFSYKPESRVLIEDELIKFYDDAEKFIRANSNYSKCIGSGILVPKHYNTENGIADIAATEGSLICRIFTPGQSNFPGRFFAVSDSKTITLNYLSQSEADKKSFLVFFINDTLESCFFRAGDNSFKLGNCGTLPFYSAGTVNDRLHKSADPELVADLISRLIVSVISCVLPDNLVLTGSRYKSMNVFNELTKNNVILKCQAAGVPVPHIITGIKDHSPVVGISSEIRDMWFHKEILENH